jgi:hypothetical protein
MNKEISSVLEFGAPEPGETAKMMATNYGSTPIHGICPSI